MSGDATGSGGSSPDPPEDATALSPGEVARLFGVTTKTVTRWAKAGKIESFRTLGGHRRFPQAAVDEAMRRPA
jgi:excisionase family DNA binding protein